jgi:hypothetical protein
MYEEKAEVVPDPVEERVREALAGVRASLGLDDGTLVESIRAALPPREEMRPELHPALRIAFGLVAVVYASSAWALDLPARLGAGPGVGVFGISAISLGAALGALAVAVSIVRNGGPRAAGAFRGVLSGPAGRAFLATVTAAAVVAGAWAFLDWFPERLYPEVMRAARASATALAVVLLVAAALQGVLLFRPQNWRRALRMIEVAGLVAVALACAANYVYFVT